MTFSEVVGMDELNDGRPRKVKNCKVRTPRGIFKLGQHQRHQSSLRPLAEPIPPSSVHMEAGSWLPGAFPLKCTRAHAHALAGR